MFCYYASDRYSVTDSIFGYPKGAGFSFYSRNRHGQKFVKWFKGTKEEACTKMDKFLSE